MVKSFHVVGDGLAWKIGRGNQVRIGIDPWPRSGNSHSLPHALLDQLHFHGIYYLNQITYPSVTNIWHQGWHSSASLGLDGGLHMYWENYIFSLREKHIRLTDQDDELVY